MWSGSHCMTALAKRRSVRGSGVQVAMSALMNVHLGSRSRALRSMSGEESSPTISDCGKRSTRSSVELPGPQPRSTTSRGRCSGTCASRSRGGRVRSSSNLRYCRALQSSISAFFSFFRSFRDLIRYVKWLISTAGAPRVKQPTRCCPTAERAPRRQDRDINRLNSQSTPGTFANLHNLSRADAPMVGDRGGIL